MHTPSDFAGQQLAVTADELEAQDRIRTAVSIVQWFVEHLKR